MTEPLDRLEAILQVADDDEHAMIERLREKTGELWKCEWCLWRSVTTLNPDVCEHCGRSKGTAPSESS